jgi:parvulin-like peptidyl-prolyl isomerase
MASKEKNKPVSHEEGMMAELFRRYHSNPFVFIGTLIILVITIIAFIFVPALAPKAGNGVGGGRLAFGSYNGVPIEFIPGNYFSKQRDYYNEQFRSSGTNQSAEIQNFQVWRAAFESTVVHVASLEEMKNAGYRVPDATVNRKMALQPEFQDNGKFSAARYRAMSDTDRLALRQDLHDQIIMDRYLADELDLSISTNERNFMKSLAVPERSFDLVAFPLTSYPDAEVSTYISAHPDLFKTIHLSKITINTSQADAAKVLDQVTKKTTTFEDAAKTYSKDEFADKSGDMGIKYAFELNTEIPDEKERSGVLNLTPGGISPVVKVPSGWAFYRLEQPLQNAQPNDSAVIAKARSYIVGFERGTIEDYLMKKANALTTEAQTVGFDKAIATQGLTKKSFGPVPINYGDVELYKSLASFKLKELAGASTSEAFWKTAFTTPLKTPSKPVVVGDNVLVLLPTDEKTTEENAASLIDYYYPYIAGQYSQQTLQNYFMGSKKLKDNFFDTFLRTFMPKS